MSRCVRFAVALLLATGTAGARGKVCTETSESSAVGRRKCTGFAWWDETSAGTLEVEIGAGFRDERLPHESFSVCPTTGGKTCSGGLRDLRVQSGELRGATGFVHVQAFRFGPLRVGAHFEIGALTAARPIVGPPALFPAPGSIGYDQAGLWAGVAFPVGERSDLRAEVVFGWSGLSGATAHLGGVAAVASTFHGVVAPRLAYAFYPRPRLAIGAYGTADVVDRNDFGAGLFLRVTSASYGGDRD